MERMKPTNMFTGVYILFLAALWCVVAVTLAGGLYYLDLVSASMPIQEFWDTVKKGDTWMTAFVCSFLAAALFSLPFLPAILSCIPAASTGNMCSCCGSVVCKCCGARHVKK